MIADSIWVFMVRAGLRTGSFVVHGGSAPSVDALPKNPSCQTEKSVQTLKLTSSNLSLVDIKLRSFIAYS